MMRLRNPNILLYLSFDLTEESFFQGLFIIHHQWLIQGIPKGGGNPKGGVKLLLWPNFPEKCMKMEKNWTEGDGS